METEVSFTVEELNDMLSDMSNTSHYGKEKSTFVERIEGDTPVSDSSYDGLQGEYDQYFKIYKTPKENIFLRVEFHTDSYGDFIYEIKFVKKVDKVVNSYE